MRPKLHEENNCPSAVSPRKGIVPVTLFLLLAMTTACQKSDNFKEIRDFPKNEWWVAHKQTFEFTIRDTTATYRFNYLVRNSVSYPFYNLYLQQKLTDSTGHTLSASMDEVILFDEKSGKPYGDGMGDIFDCRIQAPGLQAMKFSKAGKYKWILSHGMRPDPLTGILSIGAEVIRNPQ